jgi:acyl-CoA dehydrogenase
VSERHQFGKPLSSFQSTAHRAADAHIDIEAMRSTLWQAAWLLDQPTAPDAVRAAFVAAWWAAVAAPRVVQSVQHMHGGLGADVDYPIHRYYLWGTQLEVELGGASALLADLGVDIAGRAMTRSQHAPNAEGWL